MSDRQEVESRLVVNGEPMVVRLISNPTVDDVVITEARVWAAEFENGPLTAGERRVDRGIRDFLIRLGVER